MRFAESNKRAEIRDTYRTCDMAIHIGSHFVCLPSQQPPSNVSGQSSDFGINLLAHQRDGFEYRRMNRMFVMQLTDSGIKQPNYVVHPFAWPCRSYVRDRLHLSGARIHNLLQNSQRSVYVPGLLVTW